MTQSAGLQSGQDTLPRVGEPEHWALELARKTPSEQEAFLVANSHLVRKDVLQTLAEAIRVAFRTDVPRALQLADASLLIAHRLADDREVALALRARGNALSLTGRCGEALLQFHQAIDLFKQIGDREEEGRTLSTAIRSYLLLGDYDGAFHAAEQARSIFEGLGDTFRTARLEINVANIYHRQNRFGEALAVYERAYRQLLPHTDIEGIGVALHNVGVCRIILDDFRGALDAYQRLRALCEAHSMPLLVAQADYNSALLYFLRGDYTQALKLLQTTRETYRKNGDEYHLGLCDLDDSEIYIELGLSEEALEMADRSCHRFRQLGNSFEVGRALANKAIALGQQGRFSLALEAFKEAKDVFLTEENLAWPSLIDLYRSVMLCEEGEWEEAGALCGQALTGIRTAGMPGKEVQGLLVLSRATLQQGDLSGAAEHCRSAISLVDTLELPALSFQARLVHGEIEEAAGDAKAAFQSYQSCRQVLETIRSGLHTDELKIGLMRSRVEVYERLARLCLARPGNASCNEAEAFGYIETARSRSLRDLIFQRTELVEDEDAPAKPGRLRLRELRKELNWLYRRIEREELSKERLAPELLEGLRNDARLKERELLRLEREEPRSPGSPLDRESSGPASLVEIADALTPESSLVEFFAIEGKLWGAVLSATGFHVRPLADLATIYHHIRLLNFQLDAPRINTRYRERFAGQLLASVQAHLTALFHDLIAPLRHTLRGEHLVIVPWGALHGIPFHALFDGSEYLIQEFSITYAPSATIYGMRKMAATPNTAGSLIIGVDSETTPHVRYEAEMVASVVSSPALLLGAEATEANLRSKGPGSRMIHIATHGSFRQDNPMFSSIRLADSYLSLYDLYHMALPADLLTLSGCVTGVGVVREGDELVGLARGLLFAGAKSLLLSLWNVDDRSSADFMRVFYTKLQHEPRKARALRSAMLELLFTHPHPYYWAPFKLTATACSE